MKTCTIKICIIVSVLIFSTMTLGQLSGTYYIDNTASGGLLFENGGSYFRSFSEAVDTLESQGVTAAVTVEVTGGQTFTETVQFNSPIPGASAANTITFKYEGDNKPLIQPPSAGLPAAGVIDVSYDGDHYLTLEGLKVSGMNGAFQYNRGIRVVWGADHVTIRNCEVFDFNQEGIVVYWGGGGVNANASESCVVENNKVYHQDLQTSTAADLVGIYINGADGVQVRNNEIYNLIAGTTSTSGISTFGQADTNNVDIYNNFISLGHNITTDNRVQGIYVQHVAGPTVNINYNSIYLGGAVDVGNQFTAATRFQSAANLVYKNNISYNARTKNSGTGNQFAIYIGVGGTPYQGDNNDLYTDDAVLGYFATNLTDLSAWQTFTGQDGNSISVDPDFIATDDLHVFPFSPVANLGTPIAGITTDIEGESRDVTTPDIGADEFPDNTAPQITSTAELTATEDQQYSYQVMASDPDYGDTLTYSLSQAPEFLSIDENTGLITGTPTNDDVGQHSVNVVVTDLSDATGTQPYTLTVENSNDAPTISDIGNQSTDEDSATVPIAITIGDIDNDPATLTLSGTSDNLTLVDSTSFTFGGTGVNRTMVITPLQDQYGSATVTVTVSDGDLTASDSFTLSVDPVNDAPVVDDIPDQEIVEGGNFTPINLDEYVMDQDNLDSEISWSVADTSHLMVSIVDRVATITVKDIEWNGSETILFKASDPALLSDSVTATFTVTAVNDAPQISGPLPPMQFNEDDSLTAYISDLYDYVEDPDDADTSLIYMLKPGKYVTVELGDSTAILRAPSDWFGLDTLELKVSDGGLADSALVYVTVVSVNDAPVFVDLPDTIRIVHSQDTVITMENHINDVDSPLNTLVWDYSVSDEALDYSFDGETSELTITAMSYLDVVTLYITVTDDSSASISDSIVIDVVADALALEDTPLFGLPTQYSLDQNYPNPFNPSTKIRFGLPKDGEVSIELYNILGQHVMTILNEDRMAGYHIINFDASRLPSGVYFYRIQSSNFHAVKKMILLK